jgi:hypothetical protein
MKEVAESPEPQLAEAETSKCLVKLSGYFRNVHEGVFPISSQVEKMEVCASWVSQLKQGSLKVSALIDQNISEKTMSSLLGLVERTDKMLKQLPSLPIHEDVAKWIKTEIQSRLSDRVAKMREIPLTVLNGMMTKCNRIMDSDGKIDIDAACVEEFDQAVVQLQSSDFCSIAGKRILLLTRYCNCCLAYKKVIACRDEANEFDLSLALAEALQKYLPTSSAYEAVCKSLANEVDDLHNGWQYDAAKQLAVAPKFADVKSDVMRSWEKKLEKTVAALKELVPMDDLLKNGRLLVDETLRKTLAEITEKVSKSVQHAEANSCLQLLSRYEEMCEPLPKKMLGRQELKSLKLKIRLSLAVDWVVNQIIKFAPERPADLKAFTQGIQTKLAAKGFGGHKGIELPKFIVACFKLMMTPPAPPAEAAGAAASSSSSGAAASSSGAAPSTSGAAAAPAAPS